MIGSSAVVIMSSKIIVKRERLALPGSMETCIIFAFGILIFCFENFFV